MKSQCQTAKEAKEAGKTTFKWTPCAKCGGTVRYSSGMRCVSCCKFNRLPEPTPQVLFIRRVVLCFGLDTVIEVTGFDNNEINAFIAGRKIDSFVLQCFLDSLVILGQKTIRGEA